MTKPIKIFVLHLSREAGVVVDVNQATVATVEDGHVEDGHVEDSHKYVHQG